jgi:hypothetical protein
MPRRYLTPDKAAALLGWEGRKRGYKLRRILFAKEREVGKLLMVRLGGTGAGTRYGITEAQLRRHCPELFAASHDELLAEVRHQLKAIDSKVADRIVALVVPELRGFEQRFEQRLAALERSRR